MQLVSKRDSRWLTITDTYTQYQGQNERLEIYRGQVLNDLVQMLPAVQPHGCPPQTDHSHAHLDPRSSSFWKPELDCCPRSWGWKQQWIQQVRGWRQHSPGELIANNSVSGSGRAAWEISLVLSAWVPLEEWSLPLYSNSCFRKHLIKKKQLVEKEQGLVPESKPGKRPHLALFCEATSI